MSKEAVRKYVELLSRDEEFLKKIVETGEDKSAKLALIKSHELDFTREEFEEVGKEFASVYFAENGELTDEGLDIVSGGSLSSLLSASSGIMTAAGEPGVIGSAIGSAIGGTGAGFASGAVMGAIPALIGASFFSGIPGVSNPFAKLMINATHRNPLAGTGAGKIFGFHSLLPF